MVRLKILIERIIDEKNALVHLHASKTPRIGSSIFLADNRRLIVVSSCADNLYILQCDAEFSMWKMVEEIGEIPLPPYMQRRAEKIDIERYQTIYAKYKGSVAAPTAGLHFDDDLLKRLHAKKINTAYVTLHVGAGTFLPVRTENIAEHHMHTEYMEISAETCQKIISTKKNGGRVIAVGTTTARSLETASRRGQIEPYLGDTDIFIYPGYQFKCVDMLITNFHVPCSSLLMLVSAFAGYENIMRAYREAIEQRYRFYSYGDAMILV